ncbi:MAG TPA: hypothetical protein VHQ87_16090 [Rhizobacter sp.]|jgi:hypothetical protein|nr:hypothetical protein [Rhizobacter sp.]
MSGSNSSAPDANAAHDSAAGLSFTVHSMPVAALEERRTRHGRLKMLLVLLICAAPVVASYLTYFVIRPQGRTNYSELIQPQQPVPADLSLSDLKGQAVAASTLKGQWLLVVVAGAACPEACEKNLWLQRQLRESLGREKERLDKVWLISDGAALRPQTVEAVSAGTPVTALRVPPAALAAWLQPSAGHTLEDHMYIVDPMGNWMMRVPPQPDAAKLKRDIEKLMRASASWDQPGR